MSFGWKGNLGDPFGVYIYMMKWVLFDLDGTLTRSEEGIWNCAKYAAQRMGVPEPDAETLRKFIGPPLVWSFRELLGMNQEDAERAQAYYRERYTAKGLFENRVYPGIRQTLRTLKAQGYTLGVVTGKPAEPTGRILEHFGLAKWFDTVVCATDGHAEKEHLIARALPAEHGEAWMVGDRHLDMEGGVKAGVHTLGAVYGYGTEEELRKAGAEKLAFTPRDIVKQLCPDAPTPRGAFVSMEGPDGSGKGTQLERLADTLDRYGFEVLRSREPGGSPIGEKIRDVVLDPANQEMTAETEALLYAASRAQHVREVIRPAVREGKLVLCDRFADSSIAYQGGGRNLGVDTVLAMNERAIDGTWPDVTVYLDIDHRKALARRVAASVPDRMEREAESFHARVGEAYHELIRRDPGRFVTVDAEQSREEIAEQISRQVLARLTEAEN